MIQLRNTHLQVQIHPKGAELQQLFHLPSQSNYLWNAQAIWAKHSPVLFPIVGSLKDNTYRYQKIDYQLPRHGFARDKVFLVEEQTDTKATFLLTQDESTLANYPFEFELRLIYEIVQNQLNVTYQVHNPAVNQLWFSVGGHPAFCVPFGNEKTYNDYTLNFNTEEELWRWPLSPDGLIETQPTLVSTTNSLALTKSLFYEDALVFKHLNATAVTLSSVKGKNSLTFGFSGFPYVGIWAAKDADFVCIEPWCGIADSVDSTQELTQKEGIICLESNQTFERTWSVSIAEKD